MPATLDVSCPNCGKVLKVPAELEGKKIKCKGCSEVFQIKAPKAAPKTAAKAKPAAAAPPKAEEKPKGPFKDEDDDDDTPGKTPRSMGVVREDDVPRCPNCAVELDPPEAVLCKNCGFNNRTRVRAETKKTYAPQAGDWASHLAPGIIAVLIVIILIVVDVFCCVKMRDWMLGGDLEDDTPDPITGKKKFFVPPGAFIAVILAVSAIVIVPATRFAIRRLVFNAKPTEKVKK